MRAETFERQRPHLLDVAYRLLGSWSEAEDTVQDAWGRAARREDIDDARAFLTTVVTRLGIDRLRSARRRREVYVGPWLPEPLVGAEPPTEPRLASSLSVATLYLLERLSPRERAAWLLREVFEHEYEAVAEILESTPSAVRKLVSRARQHLAQAPRREVDAATKRRLHEQLRVAFDAGDPSGLVTLLTEDAVGLSDGGGVVQAARVPIVGGDKLARALLGFLSLTPEGTVFEVAWVNGGPGVVARANGRVFAVYALDVAVGGGIRGVYSVLAPDKLVRIGR